MVFWSSLDLIGTFLVSKVVWHVARLNFLDWDTQTLSDNKRLNLLIMIKSINDQTFSLLFTV